MTTLVVKLPPALARRVALTADVLKMSHEQVAIEALRLLTRSVAPQPRAAKRRTR